MDVTASQIITRALRLIRVIGQDESPSANDLAAGFEALTTMLDGWAGDPSLVPDLSSEFTTQGFADLTTPFTIPEGSSGLRRMLVFNLAIEVATEFGAEVPADTRRIADESMRAWRTRVSALHAGRITHEHGIRRRGYDITTDEQ